MLCGAGREQGWVLICGVSAPAPHPHHQGSMRCLAPCSSPKAVRTTASCHPSAQATVFQRWVGTAGVGTRWGTAWAGMDRAYSHGANVAVLSAKTTLSRPLYCV